MNPIEPPAFRDRLPAAGIMIMLTAASLLAACGARDGATGGGASADGGSCELGDQQAWVERNMNDYYLFYDRVPTVRRADYPSSDALLDALRVPPDTFSFITDAARSTALFEEGKLVGYGWHLDRRDDGALILTLIDKGSPLDLAGARRGELVRTINGVDERTLTGAQAGEALGTGEQLRTVRLGLEAADGTRREIEVTRARYTVLGVQQLDVVEQGALRVGYLNFLSFIEPARAELDRAFATLAEERVDELVLDLRFNGGGRVDVAKELASRIGGAGVQGRDFTRFRFNDKAPGVPIDGVPLPFVPLVDSLDLARIYVLTGPGTCSASEMVINGLAPFVEVITIGQPTCGKPFGFRGLERCDEAMFAVEFEFVNDAGVGGYVNGLAPDCPVTPDDVNPLGTAAESLFGAALRHIDTATCPAMLAGGAALRDARLRASDAPGGAPRRNPVDPFGNDLPPR